MEKCLVTVGILAYNNYVFLMDAIDSVLSQDYPNIELIISDDGSEDFNKHEIIDYINQKKGINIKSVYINQMEKNGGTSKNFNFVLNIAKGKYIKYLAADDLFYRQTSLSTLVDTANSKNSIVVVGRCPCYDRYLERQDWTFPSDLDWERITSFSKWDFFAIMSEYCLISAPGVLYQTEFLKQQGGADERYALIEDWPFWLKMIRSGYEFTFLNKPVVIYRLGGVSNGIDNSAYGIHQLEYASVIANEGLIYKRNMQKRYYRKAFRSEKKHRRDGLKILYWNKYSLIDKIKFSFEFLDLTIYDIYNKRISPLFNYLNSGRKKMICLGLLWLFVAFTVDFSGALSASDFSRVLTINDSYLNYLFCIMGIILLMVGSILYILGFLLNFRKHIGEIVYK